MIFNLRLIFFISFFSCEAFCRILLMGGTSEELKELETYLNIKDPQAEIDTVNNSGNPTYLGDFNDEKFMNQIPNGSYEAIFYSAVNGNDAMNSFKFAKPKLSKNGALIFYGRNKKPVANELEKLGFSVVESAPKHFEPIISYQKYTDLLKALGLVPSEMKAEELAEGLRPQTLLTATLDPSKNDIDYYLANNRALLALVHRHLGSRINSAATILFEFGRTLKKELKPDILRQQLKAVFNLPRISPIIENRSSVEEGISRVFLLLGI